MTTVDCHKCYLKALRSKVIYDTKIVVIESATHYVHTKTNNLTMCGRLIPADVAE